MKTFQKLVIVFILFLGLHTCKTQNPTVQPQTETVAVDQPKSVNIRGEELHYIEKGSGQPLIFIHGGLGDYRTWVSRMGPYSKNNYVISYSRRYAWPNKQIFEESADYSVRIHSKDLYALIQELNLKKVNLVGHSYGAFTALKLALDHPEVINALVLGEPPAASLAQNSEKGRLSWNAFLEENLRPAKQDFLADRDEAALEHFIKGVSGDDFKLAQLPQEAKQAWMNNILEIRGYALTDTSVPIEMGMIKTLEIPTLLLVGERSPRWLVEISEELHQLLPRSQMVTVENSSHGLYFDQPEAVDKAVMEFLKRN